MSDDDEKRGVGRPTKYKQEYEELAYNYCLLGATDAKLAIFFDVDESTINNWKIDFPEFLESIKKGKEIADSHVAQSLFKKATGYEHEAVKIFNDQGSAMVVPYVEKFAPDTTAAIFWLKNRQPALWRDKQEVDHRTPDGVQVETTQLSDEELTERLRRLGLGRASGQLAGKIAE